MDHVQLKRGNERSAVFHIVVTILFTPLLLLVTTNCEMNRGGDLYPGSWRGSFALDGGQTSDIPDFITLDVWYTSTLSDDADTWYGVRIVNGTTYEVYLNDRADGSGTYTGDVQIRVTNDAELIDYGSAFDGYTIPLTFTAEEDAVLIQVSAPAAGDGGTFAVGIQQQYLPAD